MPHTRIDTQAHWTKSGWHGRVYGWKLHLCCTAGPICIPRSAELTTANVADNEQAPSLLLQLPLSPLFALGDVLYNTSELKQHCQQRGRTLVTTQYGPYPHTGPGVEVRRLFHKLRSTAIENFNEQFKGIFCAHEQAPTKGETATKRFALRAVLLYQIALLHRHEQKMDLRVGLKPFLRAA